MKEYITQDEVNKAFEKFRNYREENGFDNIAKQLQKEYSKLQTKFYQQNLDTTNIQQNKLSQIEIDINSIVNDLERCIDNGYKITNQTIDEEIDNSKYYKDNYVEEDDVKNSKLFDEMFDKIVSELEKKGISSRYDYKQDMTYYDTQNLAEKGYNELLDYLDDNNINYEVTRSTNAGYVPSIYVKNKDGEIVFRIANHKNGYIDEFDMMYNDSYNKLFSDKDYANWNETILPKIKENL